MRNDITVRRKRLEHVMRPDGLTDNGLNYHFRPVKGPIWALMWPGDGMGFTSPALGQVGSCPNPSAGQVGHGPTRPTPFHYYIVFFI